MTEPDEAIKFAEAMMRSYNHLSDVVIPPTAPLRIDGRRLTGIEAHNVTQAFAQAYRAGQAASAERIKALEEALKDSATSMRLLLDAVQKHNAESDTFLSGFPLHLLTIEIASIDALLKGPTHD